MEASFLFKLRDLCHHRWLQSQIQVHGSSKTFVDLINQGQVGP